MCHQGGSGIFNQASSTILPTEAVPSRSGTASTPTTERYPGLLASTQHSWVLFQWHWPGSSLRLSGEASSRRPLVPSLIVPPLPWPSTYADSPRQQECQLQKHMFPSRSIEWVSPSPESWNHETKEALGSSSEEDRSGGPRKIRVKIRP